MTYDSRIDTFQHIATVRRYLSRCAINLLDRAHVHDASKLVSPEVEVFDVVSPRLKELTYGSPEYKASLKEMGTALQHHYEQNDHHPEHFERGVHGMDLLQLLEMICDWKAAAERHADGDVRKSVLLNAERFGYGEEITGLLLRTLDTLEAT